jgi:predicted transcriptional regulator
MITVKNVMNTDIPIISPNDHLQKAAVMLKEKKTRILVVMGKGNVLGVLPEETLLREALLKRKNPSGMKVAKVMQATFHTISPHASFKEAEMLFKSNQHARLLVMDNGKLEGIVTEMDMMAALRDFTRKDYLVQDAVLVLFGIITAFFLLYFSPLGITLF